MVIASTVEDFRTWLVELTAVQLSRSVFCLVWRCCHAGFVENVWRCCHAGFVENIAGHLEVSLKVPHSRSRNRLPLLL